MGSQQPVLAVAPQQELPPDFTRNAASPYFSFTTCLMSAVSVLMTFLLLADSNDLLRFDRLVARAALGVKKLQQLLQRFGIGGAEQERSLPLPLPQALRLSPFQMIGKGRNV